MNIFVIKIERKANYIQMLLSQLSRSHLLIQTILWMISWSLDLSSGKEQTKYQVFVMPQVDHISFKERLSQMISSKVNLVIATFFLQSRPFPRPKIAFEICSWPTKLTTLDFTVWKYSKMECRCLFKSMTCFHAKVIRSRLQDQMEQNFGFSSSKRCGPNCMVATIELLVVSNMRPLGIWLVHRATFTQASMMILSSVSINSIRWTMLWGAVCPISTMLPRLRLKVLYQVTLTLFWRLWQFRTGTEKSTNWSSLEILGAAENGTANGVTNLQNGLQNLEKQSVSMVIVMTESFGWNLKNSRKFTVSGRSTNTSMMPSSHTLLLLIIVSREMIGTIATKNQPINCSKWK